MGEEERRRKIIIDSQVIAAANHGIRLAAEDKLTSEQAARLIECDKQYLRMTAEILGKESEGADWFTW